MTADKIEYARKLFDEYGPILKTKFLNEHKLCSRELAELVSRGEIIRIKPGYYLWSMTENEITDLEKVSAVIPFGILCWYTAAQFHDLTTVNPSAIYVAIPSVRTRVSIPEHPPVVLIASSQKTFDLGIETIQFDHTSVRIYDRERTVCDFFRKRNLIGTELALEVLKNYMYGKQDLQRLFEYAKKLRIKHVIQPYVEALL